MVCVLAQAIEELKNAVLVVVLRVARVQDPEKEVVNEDANCLLEVLAEVQEEAVEDRDRPREDLVLAGHRELQESAAE